MNCPCARWRGMTIPPMEAGRRTSAPVRTAATIVEPIPYIPMAASSGTLVAAHRSREATGAATRERRGSRTVALAARRSLGTIKAAGSRGKGCIGRDRVQQVASLRAEKGQCPGFNQPRGFGPLGVNCSEIAKPG